MHDEVELCRKALAVTGHDSTDASVAAEIAPNGHTYVMIWSRGREVSAKKVIKNWIRLASMPDLTAIGFLTEIENSR